MVYVKGALRALLAQQRGQIQLLIIAPILTLSFLGLLVRSASSAVDHREEKKKVVAELKRRLDEVNGSLPQASQPHSTDLWDSSEEGPEHAGIADQAAMIPFVVKGSSRFFDELDEVKLDETIPPKLDLGQPHTFVSSVSSPFKTLYRIRKGDTLETILQGEGMASEQIKVWVAAAKKHKTLRRLRRGRHFSFVFTEGDDAPFLKSLTYEVDKLSRLIFEYKEDTGEIITRKEKLPTTVVWRAVGGQITSNLYKAALKAGVPLQIVDEMADMDWDINFSSSLKSGDTFKVIFEEIQQDGEPVEYGQVLAAEIVNKGRTSTLFSLPRAKNLRPSKKSRVADPSTETRGSQRFLRYPVRFTRVSSVFTKARFHPILKRKRPHNGVDFAAPRGTPVRAVADGKVTTAGWVGGFGRLVKIDHPGPYATEYAHLHRIAKGLEIGSHVKRGQVIGTVGSTGLATGPHLHFGLFKNGHYINPLSKDLPRTQYAAQKKAKPDPFVAKMKKKLTEYLVNIEVGSVPATQVLAALQNPSTEQTQPSEKPRS